MTEMSEGASSLFPHLFQPLKIGGVTLKNRIFSSGHDTVMAEGGFVGEQLIAYQQARAAGGVGLIIVQVAGVHETARYTYHMLMATDDTCIAGYRKLVEAVSPFDCRIFGQLFHPGREIMESQDGSTPVALAPSAVPNERFHVMPRALTRRLIGEIVEGYASAAGRLQSAGLDGVEIVASHGYLPSQFLNPAVNRREDEYGGSFEGRILFLREVIAAIRGRVGRDLVVGLRISADELDPFGLSADDALAACTALDEDGALDYFNVTAGTSASLSGSGHIVPPMSEPIGYMVPRAARVKAVLKRPVLVAGRINQPQEAERIIAEGHADACAMTRALICDPEMPRLALEGRLEDIRACIACNQACIGHFHLGYPISCIQHPETGRELAYGRRSSAAVLRRVMVVGGGPAGLKAAAVAAERGHRVTLYEAERRIGGQILLAERLPGRAEFGGAILNLAREAQRAGVDIHTGVRVDADYVRAEGPDAVIVATGARPRLPTIEVLGDPTILNAWEIVEGAPTPEGRVVVADWRGDWIGVGVAQMLVEQRRRVTLCVNDYAPGGALQQYVRNAELAALERAHVDIVPLVRLFGVDDSSVYFQHVLTGGPVIIEDVGCLVLSQGHEPNASLLEELEAAGMSPVGVGDCLAPRSVEEAVLEGLKVGNTI
jgi:2,4-dienoyl-CoA reductase-like NADH-dependent reductase (Old Yellow Enzyme family)/thioredoxin reductase